MSLFATDSSLLEPVIEPWSAATDQTSRQPADVLAGLLPQIVADALSRGHVRTAAMAFEQAASLLPFDHPAMQTARQLIDRCAADDAAIQQRQIAGEIVVVPSLTERAPGTPRFHFGVTEAELTHPTVLEFLRAEQDTGAQAELRNFLDQALLGRDDYVDLDPAAGAGVLSALSLTNGRVIAVVSDPVLQTLIARNARQLAGGDDACPVAFTGDLADATEAATAMLAESSEARESRVVVHLGSLPVSTVARQATTWRDGAIAIAWDASNASVAFYTQQELEQLGASSFVLAQDEDGMTLRPFRMGCGATTAFALTERFIDTLGGA